MTDEAHLKTKPIIHLQIRPSEEAIEARVSRLHKYISFGHQRKKIIYKTEYNHKDIIERQVSREMNDNIKNRTYH